MIKPLACRLSDDDWRWADDWVAGAEARVGRRLPRRETVIREAVARLGLLQLLSIQTSDTVLLPAARNGWRAQAGAVCPLAADARGESCITVRALRIDVRTVPGRAPWLYLPLDLYRERAYAPAIVAVVALTPRPEGLTARLFRTVDLRFPPALDCLRLGLRSAAGADGVHGLGYPFRDGGQLLRWIEDPLDGNGPALRVGPCAHRAQAAGSGSGDGAADCIRAEHRDRCLLPRTGVTDNGHRRETANPVIILSRR